MAFELIETLATLKDLKPIKKGSDDDAPLVIILTFSADLKAVDVLPHFHPTLRHSLFDKNGVRYSPYLNSISWSEQHSNMEIDIAEQTLQAEKIYKYKIAPYDDGKEDADESNRVWLGFTAKIQLGNTFNPISILSELINTESVISIRPSQLNLLDQNTRTDHNVSS